MSTAVGDTAQPKALPKRAIAPPFWTRRFYIVITLALIAMVIRGFWP